jgi:hypothetical protein
MFNPSPFFPVSPFGASAGFLAWLDLWCARVPHERMSVDEVMAAHQRMKADRAKRAEKAGA